MAKEWSNLAKIVYRRTYARKDSGSLETWAQTVDRVIEGNFRKVLDRSELRPEALAEKNAMRALMLNRKAGPAGRGYWFSGTAAHARIGGVALNNCWFLTSDSWENFVVAMDLLMLGGGVGLSVEHQFTSKLPRVKKGVVIECKNSKDADFIVPDSREGWCELLRRVLEAYFVTGRSFCYSPICVRGFGEPIKGFGGTASGPFPLTAFIENITKILGPRAGKAVRPVDAMDLICATGEMVVAGNIRRSALLILGDAHDKEYLKAKRWDLGPVPTYRATANLSVVCDDVEDLHPLFWKTYEHGEPFGLVNRRNIQTYGRMGEFREDSAIGVNPCVPAGTEILTEFGYKAIETLVGEKIHVWNGFEWSEVEPKVTGYNQKLVTVKLSSGQSLTCTRAHKFVVETDYKGHTKRVSAKDLRQGMRLLKTNYPILTDGESDPQAYQQGLVSARWHVELNGYVPMHWDLPSRLAWFAGVLDAAGAFTRTGGVRICLSNRAFLLAIQKLLTTAGVGAKVARTKQGGKFGKYRYKLIVDADELQTLLALGLKCSYLALKANPDAKADRRVKVTSVEPAGTADVVYCFTEPKRNLGCFEGVVTGQCAEATLEPFEPCNLTEQALANLETPQEFLESSKLCYRYAKRVTLEHYHHSEVQKVIERNRRVGVGITGCLESPLFRPEILNDVYQAIQAEDERYSAQLGVPRSIRTTVIKPSGTMSKVLDQRGEGIHAAYSRYMIQRIRVAANDPLIPLLRAAGHYMEPVVKFDGSLDPTTLVVDFYLAAPAGMPCADEGFDTWKQLDTLLMAQRYWADQAVSVTIYYRKEEISQVKAWLALNLKYLKTISFLCHNDHGFKQAPKEAITKEQYEELSAKVRPIELEQIEGADLDSLECASGSCPIK